MKQIRKNTFETNSSSVHSITMCSYSEYEDWKDGYLWLNTMYGSESDYADHKFVTNKEAIDIINKYKYGKLRIEADLTNDELDEVIRENHFELYSYDYYFNEFTMYFETFEERYSTKGGEEIVSFGYYGHD